MLLVGHGTLPEYREDGDAIEVQVNLGKSIGKLKDNFIIIEIEEDDRNVAYQIASQELDRFLRHLTLSQEVLFTYTPMIFESEKGDLHPIPRYVEFSRVTAYNLERMKENIELVQGFLYLSDPKLDKSLQYFEQAILLNRERSRIAPVLSRNHSRIVSSIFLNLWKALSVVVGDPSVDSDYQKRYKSLGFNYEYFKTKIEWIRKRRNDYDVAHYSISEQEIGEINENYGKAQRIVIEVLQRYREVLLDSSRS